MINGKYIGPAYSSGIFGPDATVKDSALKAYTEIIVRECARIASEAASDHAAGQAILDNYEIE